MAATSKPTPRILAYAPEGSAPEALVVSASRAGGLGVLDSSLAGPSDALLESARTVARYLDGTFSARLPADAIDQDWLRKAPDGLATLIGLGSGNWPRSLEEAHASGRGLLAEVTSLHEAFEAAEAGADGLILAGHEAGGWCSNDSSFILLQKVLARFPDGPPVWVRGGIGPGSAAACVAGGARGIVLDGALLLARESSLPEFVKERIARWDGSETRLVSSPGTRHFRGHIPAGSTVFQDLKVRETQEELEFRKSLNSVIGFGADQIWPVGQDSALAGSLARRFGSVAGIVRAVEDALTRGIALARQQHPLAEKGPLAIAHGTRYPIVQGPMTRVSDVPAFARAVAEGGALPFLALALMRGPEIRELLEEARATLGDHPWGVGILGFVPPELRREQMEELLTARPPFALIAGGRPDQSQELESAGITTYMHVPSPELLRQFLAAGARRFVLEGRECGGHVGPRSSSVLWEQANLVLGEAIHEGLPGEEVHLLYAGGIHNARSAAMVEAMASSLVELGVKVGALVGTAYLFTREAAETGAIVPGFQEEVLRCADTVLLETGPGHEVRVSPTPFAEEFDRERRRLLDEGTAADIVRERLERLNTGRLRLAAKGLERLNGAGSPLVEASAIEQKRRGLYMIGQVATLRDRVVSIAELHEEIASASHAIATVESTAEETTLVEQPSDIAIVGLAAIMPGAIDVRRFWENTLRGVDAIVEVPPDRWDWRLYYDPDPKAPDKISSKWGGFLPAVSFDPLRYGMPPSSLSSIEPMQLLLLETVRSAIEDAGYRERPLPRERTAVVLGAGGGAAQLAMGYAFRSYLPLLDTAVPGAGAEAIARCGDLLPRWTEDSFPGILLNVAAGRVANRFDLGGANYTVDAACGSSLAAAALAVRELESGTADCVILAGADTVQNPFTYLAFSKTHAFSPSGRCRPFDTSADGIVISEGIAAVVLKRLADAERDGDRIYAVIKGVGASSDGRAKGLTAPHPEGQVRALTRAYAKAGISPGQIGYIEAHGTGTPAGDLSEVAALQEVFGASGLERGSCALGSVKSVIGQTKCAAGLAGLINATLALHHRVLPPTIGVSAPNARLKIAESSFYINTIPRPWLHDSHKGPRRAGVSAFGFGGTNFHAVLEAYEGDPSPLPAPLEEWPSELFLWSSDEPRELIADLSNLIEALETETTFRLRDLSRTLLARPLHKRISVGIVSGSKDDLRAKLERARQAITAGQDSLDDPSGVVIATGQPMQGKPVAFVFPGQGAQYPFMGGDLAVAFPEVLKGFEDFDRGLREHGLEPVGPTIFGPPAFDEADREARRTALTPTEIAQPAVGAASVAMLRLLEMLGLTAGAFAGHSYGELVALHAAGSLSLEDLAVLSEGRGRLLRTAAGSEPGAMAALSVGPSRLGRLIEGLGEVIPANWNGPEQTVVSGDKAAVEKVVERARDEGIRALLLPVACAFHTPRMIAARDPLIELARSLPLSRPQASVYSNTSAAPYPDDPSAIATLLGDHAIRPVRFAEMIQRMYDDGARVFIEVGPGASLSPLIGSVLKRQPHLAVSLDRMGRPGLPILLQALARLAVSGVALNLSRLTERRGARILDLKSLRPLDSSMEDRGASPGALWLVDGARVRPADGPEPARFGVGPALPGSPSGLPAKSTHGHLQPHKRAGRNYTNGVTGHRDSSAASGAMKNGIEPLRNGSTHPSRASGSPDTSRAIVEFQQTMREFLEVQRATMLEYLGHARSSLVVTEPESWGATTARPPVSAEPNSEGGDRPSKGQTFEESPAARVPNESDVKDRLLRIVRERTGYPAEMLRLDLDIEADLGIDSIKRVEILGSLRDSFPILDRDRNRLDALSRARTLGAIIDLLPLPQESRSAVVNLPSAVKSSPPRRRLLETAEARLPARKARLSPGGIVLVTDDGRGVARALAAELRSVGIEAIRIKHGASEGDVEGIDLASESSVTSLVSGIRDRGRICALIHLLPLQDNTITDLDPKRWSARLGPDVRGLFLLARALADDLAQTASQGGACLLAATALGGTFGSVDGLDANAFPGHGAISGFVKTLGHEWPGIRARVVDFNPAEDTEVLAAHLVREIFAEDNHVEVGYREGKRVSLRASEVPHDPSLGSGFQLEQGEPIIVTGGARGITAAVVGDLANRWRPTLLLLGTSPLPPAEEATDTVGVTDQSELKDILRSRLLRERSSVAPSDVERAYRALRNEREIRTNLAAFVEAGARVDYRTADVRDPVQLGRVVQDWNRLYPRPVGLIHGAGVIRDKLLRDKTPESFDNVLGTKLEGALHLMRLVDLESLRFLAFFSSISGRFGNRGQTDYAAANDALNKLAIWLDGKIPGRVVSLNWGPWSNIGMVSNLESHLSRKGLEMIDPAVGRVALAEELMHGRKGQVEVIVASGLGSLETATSPQGVELIL